MNEDDGAIRYVTFLALVVAQQTGCSILMAVEAANSTAIEHPEWPNEERRTFEEWMEYERAEGA